MQTRHRMKGSEFFQDGLRIYVNRAREDFELGQHEHDFIEMTYVAEGAGYHYLGDRVLPASRGDLFALPVGSSHVFRPYSKEKNRRLVVYNVLFAEELLEEIARDASELGLEKLWRSLGEGPVESYVARDSLLRLEPLFERMHEEHASSKPGRSAMLRSMLTELLIEWTRLLRANTRPGEQSGGDLIGDAVAFVRDRAAEPLSLRSVADNFRLSERHFQRLFKRHTGQTFHEFVQKQRIQTACELLLSTRHKLDAISGMVGYRDLQSFARVFKRTCGCTPGQYRQSEARRPL